MNITKQQLLAGDNPAFHALLCTCYIPTQAIADSDIGVLDAARCRDAAKLLRQNQALHCQQDIDVVLAQLPDSLSLMDKAYIQFCWDILQPYISSLQLDEALKPQQVALQQHILYHSLANPVFWLQSHALKNLSDFLYLSMLGWQEGFGQHSDKGLALYQDCVQQILTVDLEQTSRFTAIEQEARKAFAEQQQFLDKFAQRMKTAETAKIKNQASQLEALLFINHLTKGKTLPEPLIRFLQDKLVGDLHWFLVNQGIDSKVWQQIKHLLTQLVDMYQDGASLNNSHKQLPNLLQTFIEQYLNRDEQSDEILNLVAFDISQLAVGNQPDHCQVAGALALPGHLQNLEKHVSQQLLNNSKQFKENQWFIWHNDEQWLRCQLCVSLEQYNQVLFSNFVGQRVLACSYDDFAYLLAAKRIQALSQYGSLTRCFHVKLDKLLEGFDLRYQKQQVDVDQLKKQRLIAQEKQAKQAAAEKARLEAEAIAKRKIEAEKAAKKQQIQDDLKRQTRLSIDSLALGSWVDFVAEDGALMRAKLAVKLNASGRFIFVDDGGITIAEVQRDELIERLLNGKLLLLDSDKKFTERLAKVVSDLRTLQE